MAGGHPNLYLYCANDPVNGKDPSGLQEEDIFTQVGVREDRMGGRNGLGAARGKRAITQAKVAAQFTLELIPIEQYRKAVSGKDCWNQNVGAGERIFIFAATAAGSNGSAGKGLLSRIKGWFSKGSRGKPKNPLDGVSYDLRVLRQVGGEVINPYPNYHAFPQFVDNYAHLGTVSNQMKNGRLERHISLPGAFRGIEGVFEWTVDDQNICYHRLFRPDK